MKRMNKFAALFLSAALVTACAACGNDAGTGESDSSASEESSVESTDESDDASDAETEESSDEAEEPGDETEESSEESDAESEASDAEGEEASGEVMSHAEYVAAELETPVVVETYVQGKQSWWDNKATLYTQDQDGAYFIYELPCSEEDYEKLNLGTKIKVSGFKAEWSGEVEIIDASFEFVEDGDTYIAEPVDVTALLGKDELIDHQNEYVSFKGMTVEPAEPGSDSAFLYNYDGSGEDGNDLYFNVSLDGETYTFTVESYLCDNTTAVYDAVKNLKVGDKIDMEGFLYWYNGVNPHIISVTPAE